MNYGPAYGEAVANIEKALVKGKLYKADIYLVNVRGHRYIVKDFSAKGFWERNLIGRVITGREFRAYRALSGVEGLPTRYQKLSQCCIAIEYLEGKDLGGVLPDEIGPGIIRQFERIVAELHKRGWVHLDLQRRSNILLVDGKVFVVDLASSFHPGGIPLIGGTLTRLLGFFDRLSLIKLKKLYSPDALTGNDLKWLRLRNLVMPTKW